MKKLTVFIAILMATFLSKPLFAADVTLKWDVSADATEYIVYQSVDMGTTWDSGTSFGAETTGVITDVPDTGLVLFRVSAKNVHAESISIWSGAWYRGDWKPPELSTGLGIE